MMEVIQISKDKWLVEVTNEDKKKITCIVSELRSKTELPSYGLWKSMNSEDVWEEILGQFCVMGSARPIEKLQANTNRYDEFLDKLSVKKLSQIKSNRKEYIAKCLEEYRATRFYNKRAASIDNCLGNEEIIKDTKVVLLEDFKKGEVPNEERMRDILLEKLPFFKMKSISDFMITIGMARNLIAFDTRVVGLLNRHFGLNVKVDEIQSDKILYKAVEGKLRDVCNEVEIELSLLDRMLFRFYSIIESIITTQCPQSYFGISGSRLSPKVQNLIGNHTNQEAIMNSEDTPSLHREFWKQLLERSSQKGFLFFEGIHPSGDYWMSKTANLVTFQYAILRHKARIQLAIESEDRGKNKDIYKNLESNREQIEKDFENELEWLERPNCIYSRIAYVVANNGLQEKGQWANIQGKMIDAMARFEKAISKHIQNNSIS